MTVVEVAQPTPRRERFRQTMRYRRRYLQNRRTHLMRKAAEETQRFGGPNGATSRKIRNIERDIEAYNSLAEDLGLPAIR